MLDIRTGNGDLIIGDNVRIISDASELKKTMSLLVLSTSATPNMASQPIDGVTRIEYEAKEDSLTIRRGGLSHVAAKILAQNKRAYIIGYNDIRGSNDAPRLIGRMLFNIRIARKAKTPVILCSYADDELNMIDLNSFWKSIGVPEEIINKSQYELKELVRRAKLRASDKYVAEGIRLA